MSNSAATNTATSWKDYLELTKPKVVLLILLTAVVGMYMAPVETVPIDVLIIATVGIGFASGGAAVVNHVVDQRIDAIMARTLKRPVATGKIDSKRAILFAVFLSVTSMVLLYVFINPLTAVLTFFGLVGYAFVYTMYLKRATPQNIVIGGLSGAIPPLLGWTAVDGQVHPHALLLVLIIFVWTPPHFWALAIFRRDEYAKAEIPMLPVTHGIAFTKLNIVLYTILLLFAAALPYLTGMSKGIYLISSTILGLIFLFYAIKLKNSDERRIAMDTFKYSINYLMLLFVALLVDRYLPVEIF
ncbi:heme o synthase [Aliikangiella coralliicola]|uniref:Protoheme IX farnesyltransferase n=1 Tax=Aliikangiella coralliicola TaxID=2592383 RepID=A0A545UH72_9GAMM|nr:heme o synthase [Aliikangiella coralliicola]TQV88809.1 protoheme IX farnesyltransferase [Aliikangiella coralliicola]